MTKPPRGFAKLDPEARRAMSSKGGKSVASANRTFSKDREQAAAAGRKGGEKSKPPWTKPVKPA